MDSVALIGAPAPEFELEDLDGNRHSLHAVRGSIVVLNFWSAECVHSRRADAVIEVLKVGWGQDVRLWCVLSNENEDDVLARSVAQDNKIGLILRDRDHKVADAYSAVTTPHIFVIDQDGELRYAGGLDDVSLRQRTPTVNYLHDAVRALLQGRSPAPAETPAFGCAIVRQVGT